MKDQKISDDPQVEHNFTYQDYPKVQSRVFKDFDASSAQGTFWFFIPVMISFLSMVSEVVLEKEKKLRQGLTLFGITSLSYWSSWTLFIFIFDIFFAFLITASGKLFGYSLFTNTPFLLMCLVFYSELFAYHCLGLLLVTYTLNFRAPLLTIPSLPPNSGTV